MKSIVRMALVALIAIIATVVANSAQESEMNEITSNEYDSVLANQLGADDYGMRQYVMVFLKSGPKRDQDEKTANEIQRAHLDNIKRLADEGKLVLAGPFLNSGDLRGIFILNVANIKEAEEITKTDPAVKAGRLVMELHPWYGSAALMKVSDLHKLVAKKSI